MVLNFKCKVEFIINLFYNTPDMKLGLKIVFLLFAILTSKELIAQNNSTYKQLIEEADLYLKVGDIGFARIDYQKAIAMNPSDEYPRLKLVELDRKDADQHRNDSLYEQSLISAEKYFKSGNLNLAQIEFRRAQELKPESEFVKGRLAAISASVPKEETPKTETVLASLKTEVPKQETPKVDSPVADKSSVTKAVVKETVPITQKPDDKKVNTPPLPIGPTPLQTALTQGDEFLAVKDYENATQSYQTALALKPADKTIKVKLTSTRLLLDKQKKDQQAYADIIQSAEKAASQKNLQQAITFYEKAATIKPEDISIQNKLITLRDKLNVEQNLDKAFKEIIAKSDILLHDNNLTEAKKNYEQAHNIKPDEKYPQDKLLEISRIEAIAEADKAKKYKETIVLADALLKQEDFNGALQAYTKASGLQTKEEYPKQKIADLNIKLKALEAQYKIAYTGFISDANKAFQDKNWDIAMDNYLKAQKAKVTDTLAGNRINKIIKYMDNKLVITLTPPSTSILEGKEVRIPFKTIESIKKRNQYLVVRVKNSEAGTPRLYIGYGQDAQKNGAIIYRTLMKGGQYIDYVVRIVNQDRWYRQDNNWISLTVEGGTLEIENLKICSDI